MLIKVFGMWINPDAIIGITYKGRVNQAALCEIIFSGDIRFCFMSQTEEQVAEEVNKQLKG